MKRKFSLSRFYAGISVIMVFLLLVLILPNEILAEKYHIDLPLRISDIYTNYSSVLTKTPDIICTINAEVSPDQDTQIKSSDGKITLNIPRGAVTRQTEIELIEYVPPSSTGMVMFNLFELNAKEKESGTVLSKFNKNLEISIKHGAEDLNGIDIDSLQIYYLDEKTRQWLTVSSNTFDAEKNTLLSTTDHFSYFGEQGNSLQVGPGRVMASQVNLHSGTATFNYPLELPPGPGGFKPKLELTYNSGSVDEMKDKRSVGSWVGIGWSLHFGKITCDSSTGQYFLDLNGASYKLITLDGLNFRTNPEEYLIVTRNSINGNTWTALDKDGYYYRFGGTADSEQYTSYYGTNTYYRWDLNLIEDTNENEATITYVQNIVGSYPDYWVSSAYPEYLEYGGTQVHFTCGTGRIDNPIGVYYWQGNHYVNNPAPRIIENRKLDSIEIEFNENLIRKYNFNYSITSAVYSDDYEGIYYSGDIKLTSNNTTGCRWHFCVTGYDIYL